jgi:hypothetical protein
LRTINVYLWQPISWQQCRPLFAARYAGNFFFLISSEAAKHCFASERIRQAAEKLFSEGVILSEAKDLLSARAESKADPKRKIGATSG